MLCLCFYIRLTKQNKSKSYKAEGKLKVSCWKLKNSNKLYYKNCYIPCYIPSSSWIESQTYSTRLNKKKYIKKLRGTSLVCLNVTCLSILLCNISQFSAANNSSPDIRHKIRVHSIRNIFFRATACIRYIFLSRKFMVSIYCLILKIKIAVSHRLIKTDLCMQINNK